MKMLFEWYMESLSREECAEALALTDSMLLFLSSSCASEAVLRGFNWSQGKLDWTTIYGRLRVEEGK